MSTLQEELYALENLLLEPEIRKSQEKLDGLLADEFREFGSSGRIFYKDDVLKNLPVATHTTFVISEFKIAAITATIVLTTYRLLAVTKEEKISSLRSSLWKKHNTTWQMFFHQGTKVG